MVLSQDPEKAYGCAAKAGAGTELRTVGALNRVAEPRGGAGTGPLDAYIVAELRNLEAILKKIC